MLRDRLVSRGKIGHVTRPVPARFRRPEIEAVLFPPCAQDRKALLEQGSLHPYAFPFRNGWPRRLLSRPDPGSRLRVAAQTHQDGYSGPPRLPLHWLNASLRILPLTSTPHSDNPVSRDLGGTCQRNIA